MISSPFDRFRPTRTADGEGGFTPTLGVAQTIWGLVTVHEESTMMLVNAMDDVELGDIIPIGNNDGGAETGQYRVTGFKEVAGFSLNKQVMLEKVTKPISP